MMTERKTLIIFIILIITATFNLIYSGIGHAALTINGPGQMPVVATQNYTATGGSGSYSGWGISGGVGSFSGSGDSVFFTAPNITSNTNCNANPTICVIDSEGSIACKKIAVNVYVDNRVVVECQDIVDSFCARTSWTLKVN